VAGAGLPTKEEEVLVIVCAGILGWLLILGITLCLGAAAKRGDDLERDGQRFRPESEGANVIPLRPHQARRNPPAWCGFTRCD
jgi:hypothetical protein